MPDTIKTGLELLREPFPENQISQLPKPTCKNDDWKKLPKATCSICGGYHATSKTIHLAYVGHAALTDRLLDCDDGWEWEPFSVGSDGLPVFDKTGGLWIRLTVCGKTRPGYGNAKPNTYADVGSREKEVIGDALRNAAMRFGAALDLWHKGDLHIDDNWDDTPPEKQNNTPTQAPHKALPPSQDKKTHADFFPQIDALETASDIIDWEKQFKPQTNAELNPLERGKLKRYINQMVDIKNQGGE